MKNYQLFPVWEVLSYDSKQKTPLLEVLLLLSFSPSVCRRAKANLFDPQVLLRGREVANGCFFLKPIAYHCFPTIRGSEYLISDQKKNCIDLHPTPHPNHFISETPRAYFALKVNQQAVFIKTLVSPAS